MDEAEVIDVIGGEPGSWGWKFGPRFWARLGLLYLACGFFCYEELVFRFRSVEVPGTIARIGNDPKGGSVYRYEFRSPDDGSPRQSTVRLRSAAVPAGVDVTVQWISGVPGRSRLKSQQSTAVPALFGIWTGVMLLGGMATVAWYAWEAHHPPLTRQQRAMLAWERKQRRAVG